MHRDILIAASLVAHKWERYMGPCCKICFHGKWSFFADMAIYYIQIEILLEMPLFLTYHNFFEGIIIIQGLAPLKKEK